MRFFRTTGFHRKRVAFLVAMAAWLALVAHPDKTGAGERDVDQLVSRSTWLLYQYCKSETELKVNWCDGYLSGMADVLIALGNSNMPGGICGAVYDQSGLRSVFIQWVEKNADKLGVDRAVSVQNAFTDEWPCNRRFP